MATINHPSTPVKFALGATLLAILVLIGLIEVVRDRNVWEGWSESRELRQPAYAERVHIDDVFRTRTNTWSNLAFVFVGFYSFALCWQDLRRSTPSEAGYLVRTPAMGLAFGLACCYLGVGSGLFHASLTRFGQQLDVAAMYAPLLVLIAVNLDRWIPSLPIRGRSLPTYPILIALVVLVCVILFYLKWSMSSKNVLSTLIVSLSLFALLDRFSSSRKTNVRWLLGSSAAFVAGVACRQLDVAGRFTGPDAWLQGHALWHLLTSLSLGCMLIYYRSEVVKSTTLPPSDHRVEK